MARNVIEIANRIISLSRPEYGDIISNLKLQKLLYYVQGFNLAFYGKPIFNEDIYAWQYGPVVREAYHHFKTNSIGGIITDTVDFVELSEEESALISDVWNVYGQYSAYRLMVFTHDESPWKSTQINNIITHEKLKDYFITQIKE